MFVDASVIVAIIREEPGFEELEKRIASADGAFFVSPLVKFEASNALARARSGATKRPSSNMLRQAQAAVDEFIEALGAEEISISPEIGNGAIEASCLYGKAVGHPAGLNLGDCFAYACAKACQVDLFYKGNDFAATDLA
ncbi:VapC toxin family PIN domain ribonuclease [Phyllobacterium zundukense]|uniref:VapC toxin family PIN domain ribonuclease n=2 Tax=Phyllobacterium zundukense TaxID=1867719 RepID=A0A2N9VR19_9HYPH|nr:VapC toxin family PIN domain ribonuclease [Phyllobacterium zundukense]PIO41937.1 VapC toxin family PIN domain ribonuclease [Phyllobacterium zundukense]